MLETNPFKPGLYSASNQLLLRKAREAHERTLDAIDDEIYAASSKGIPTPYMEFVQARTNAGWS